MSRTASKYPFPLLLVLHGSLRVCPRVESMCRGSRAKSRCWLPAVVQAFEWWPQQRHQFSADFHQIQQFLAVWQESLELFGTGEQLTQRCLLVEFRLGYRHYLDVCECGAKRSGRHLQALEDVREQQPVSRSEKRNERKINWLKKRARALLQRKDK